MFSECNAIEGDLLHLKFIKCIYFAKKTVSCYSVDIIYGGARN